MMTRITWDDEGRRLVDGKLAPEHQHESVDERLVHQAEANVEVRLALGIAVKGARKAGWSFLDIIDYVIAAWRELGQ